MFSDQDRLFMNLAIAEAKISYSKNEVPVGAILVDNATNSVISSAYNQVVKHKNSTKHAEMILIEKACKILSKNLKPLEDEYLSKFNIYCLIKNGKSDQAQLVYDLKKESYIKVEEVDLASPVCQDRIISNQDPRKFNIRIADFL